MKNNYRVTDDGVVVELKHKGLTYETKTSVSDLPKLEGYPNTWQINLTGYAPRVMGPHRDEDGKKSYVMLHRFLTNAPKGFDVDHINHDTLDNRQENLRVVTRAENMQNRAGAEKRSKSGIRGVSWDNTKKKWVVFIKVNRKSRYMGSFDDIEEAREAAELARINFMPFSSEATFLSQKDVENEKEVGYATR